MEEVQRYQEEKERSISAQRDYETALFHQIQADKEFEREQIEQAIKKSQISDEQVVPKPVFNRANKPVDNAVTATSKSFELGTAPNASLLFLEVVHLGKTQCRGT